MNFTENLFNNHLTKRGVPSGGYKVVNTISKNRTNVFNLRSAMSTAGRRLIWPIGLGILAVENHQYISDLILNLNDDYSIKKNGDKWVVQGSREITNTSSLPNISGLSYPQIYESNSGTFYYKSVQSNVLTVRKFTILRHSCHVPQEQGDPPCEKSPLLGQSLNESMTDLYSNTDKTSNYWIVRHTKYESDDSFRSWNYLYELRVVDGGVPIKAVVTTNVEVDEDEIDSHLDSELLEQPLSDEALHRIANELLKKTGTVSTLDQIALDTVSETLKQISPSLRPLIKDLFTFPEPKTEDLTEGQTHVPPTANGQDYLYPPPDPSINPESEIDYFDPNIKEPILDDLPDLLTPFKQQIDSSNASNFSIPGGQCPKPEFEAFNKIYVLDSHCQIVEQNRQLISGLFILFWSILSFVIVLKA